MELVKSRSQMADIEADDGEFHPDDAMRVPGQRDPERTRRAILEAATVEFVSNGFAGASVNEIAARANVNKRMLYHYFGKKEELYIAVLERTYIALRTAQTQLKLSDMPPATAIETFILFTWNYYLQYPELLSLMTTENLLKGKYLARSERVRDLYNPLMTMLSDILERGAKDGVFRPDIDPRQLYISIASLSATFIATRCTLSTMVGRDLSTQEELLTRSQHVVDVILRYLRP
jgi:AcrR family transcriptional regulator